jgi:hypothetical protein
MKVTRLDEALKTSKRSVRISLKMIHPPPTGSSRQSKHQRMLFNAIRK